MVSGRGIACVAYEGNNGYAALVAEVMVDLQTGEVRPTHFTVAIDVGPISNPDGLRNQTEGGLLQGMSRALIEEVTWTGDRITSTDWETYRSLYVGYPIPVIDVVHVTPSDVTRIRCRRNRPSPAHLLPWEMPSSTPPEFGFANSPSPPSECWPP